MICNKMKMIKNENDQWYAMKLYDMKKNDK